VAQKEYGKLHAEWYELASARQDHREEIEFWAASIAAAGEPVLELGSGTGRVLIPLLERGIDIWGIDTSEPMLERCRALCAARGLRPVLQDRAMQDFTLAREFALVFLASGGLGLFIDERDIQATFARVHAHLKPGGVFIYEFEQAPAEPPTGDGGNWKGDWVRGPGEVTIAWRKRHKYDPATRTWTQCMIFEKFVGGRLVETEASDRAGRVFTVDEATRFARSAGFIEVRATAWLTEEPPAGDAHVATIRCRKP
jgi:SAM-dependent methyltransferase